MEFILVRDSTGNWWDINDIYVLLGFPTSSADEVVAYVLKVFPKAVIKVVWD
jgi:hypothetical protein